MIGISLFFEFWETSKKPRSEIRINSVSREMGAGGGQII